TWRTSRWRRPRSSGPSAPSKGCRPPRSRSGGNGRPRRRAGRLGGGLFGDILGVVLLEKLLLPLLSGEAEPHEHGARADGEDAGQVCRLVALQEGGLRGGRDLARVRRVLRGDGFGPVEGLGQLVRDARVDVLPRLADERSGRRGVAGREQGSEDGL